MLEAIIRNLLSRIPWHDFWEPKTGKHKLIKYGIIALVLVLGIGVFLIQLDELQTYEYACANPIILEADRTVVDSEYWFTGGTYYEIYLSYEYDGIFYENVFYMTSKNPGTPWDGIKTVTVALAPNDPGVPIRNMFQEGPVFLAIILWSVGLSMLIYGMGLTFPAFRQWRVRRANHPGLFSRPYGKPFPQAENPDYGKDWFFTFTPVIIISAILIILIFPYSFGA